MFLFAAVWARDARIALRTLFIREGTTNVLCFNIAVINGDITHEAAPPLMT